METLAKQQSKNPDERAIYAYDLMKFMATCALRPKPQICPKLLSGGFFSDKYSHIANAIQIDAQATTCEVVKFHL